MDAYTTVGLAMMLIGLFSVMSNEESGFWILVTGAALVWFFGV